MFCLFIFWFGFLVVAYALGIYICVLVTHIYIYLKRVNRVSLAFGLVHKQTWYGLYNCFPLFCVTPLPLPPFTLCSMLPRPMCLAWGLPFWELYAGSMLQGGGARVCLPACVTSTQAGAARRANTALRAGLRPQEPQKMAPSQKIGPSITFS